MDDSFEHSIYLLKRNYVKQGLIQNKNSISHTCSKCTLMNGNDDVSAINLQISIFFHSTAFLKSFLMEFFDSIKTSTEIRKTGFLDISRKLMKDSVLETRLTEQFINFTVMYEELQDISVTLLNWSIYFNYYLLFYFDYFINL